MADNFVLFSDVVRRITPPEREWLTHLLESEADPRPELQEVGVDTTDVDSEAWPGFQWRFVDSAELHDAAGGEGRELDLWLYAGDSGTPQHVAAVVQGLLRQFRPGACWWMTWADVCSKPCVGEFGGAGVFVTAESVTYHDPVALLRRQATQHSSRGVPAADPGLPAAPGQPPSQADREISTVMICSTVHITAADAELLEAAAESSGCELIVHAYEEGFFVHCGVDGDGVMTGVLTDGARLAGFGEDFCGLIRLAIASGCKWVNLDRDRPIYADLPQHHW